MKIFKLRNVISLTEKYYINNVKLKIVHYLVNIVISFILIGTLSANVFSFTTLLSATLLLAIMYFFNRFMKSIREKFFEELNVREKLLYVLRTNNLFTTAKNTEGQKVINNSAVLSYLVEEDQIVIRAHLRGDSFGDKLKELDLQLSSSLKIDLEQKQQTTPEHFDYQFLKVKDNRLTVDKEVLLGVGTTMRITENLSVDISKVSHGLTIGGTGSGKSFFINAKILAYSQMSGKGWKGADIRISDPKASDLSLYRYVTGFEGKVAVEPNEIAKMLREGSELVERRYREMFSDISAFGKTFVDFLGVAPVVIFIDEFAALMKTVDKKTHAEITKHLYNIVLKGRACGVFVEIILQRPDASVLEGSIRDQLGTRVGLSNLSSDGRQMLFGKTEVDFKPIKVKGGGYISIDSITDAPTYFETPLLLQDFDFLGKIENINSKRIRK